MDKRRILLTGATGFLGGELLRRLLERDARRIVCLVRAPSDAAAAERGAQAHRQALGRDPIGFERSRVEWLRGDVEQPGFGLSEARCRELAASVGEIYHCAATTRFDLPLTDAHSINVRGVESVLQLAEIACGLGGFARLHHVSTAFAAGRHAGEVTADHLPEDRARHFRNTYERTKARAERVLRQQKRVPYTIYRPSIIVGDSRTGRTTGWSHVYFPMRLMALGLMPFAPCGGRQLLDCVPVDFVSDAIIALSRRKETIGGAYHLTAGDDAMTVRDIIYQTYAGLARWRDQPLVVGTRTLGPVRWFWLDRAYRLVARGRARRQLERFRSYVPYTNVSTIYDNRREGELLAKDGLAPPASASFFPRIVDYALEVDFGRERAARRAGR